ncbi:alpha-amylase family protein [Salibacterium aidingense]|uniref:alpha-amylase family protein n=1 Tax=Salibacterium aidingense TaxID=384933 RepID=UPI000687CB51|nr:alpha-amylase family protein [Salibacterium aidingense]
MTLPFRQIHLDFHTSPFIPDAGEDFDAITFAKTLKDSFVNSVTVFAKCHHGYSYYSTEAGIKHPSLKRDLLAEMMKACHAEGLRVPVYLSVVWDEAAAEKTNWRQIDRKGQLVGRKPLSAEDNTEAAGWKWLCMNSPYMDYLEKQTLEVVKNYEADGLFFDIVHQTRPGCVCPYCLESMKEKQLDLQVEADLYHHSLRTEQEAMQRLEQAVHQVKPELPLFFNGRVRLDYNIQRGIRQELPWMTHVDIESLPSGLWGYNHFPLYASFYKILDQEFAGMTGRFHKMWGDFGSLKNKAALEYECFQMLAHGAKCVIGDQLHPRGRLDNETYELIRSVYEQVSEKEEWCRDVKPVDEIGVLVSQHSPGVANSPSNFSDEGALRMLMEEHRLFSFLDEASDFSPYSLIIAPDVIPFTERLTEKIQAFLDDGGKLLFSHQAGLNEKGMWEIGGGVIYEGELPFSPDYIKLSEAFDSLSAMPQVFYEEGSRVKAVEGARVPACVYEPYFNRGRDMYMSHFHTPVSHRSENPAMVQTEQTIYLAHPVFAAYRKHGNLAYKQLVDRCLAELLPEPLIETNLPSTAQVTMNAQPAEERWVLHFLHYVHQRRAEGIDVIEEVLPLYAVTVSLRLKSAPQQVYMAPTRVKLDFSFQEGVLTFTVPEIRGHQMAVIQF